MARSVRSKRRRANNAVKREKLKRHEAKHLTSILDRLKENLGVGEDMVTGMYWIQTLDLIQTEPIDKQPKAPKQKVKVKITVEGK